MKYHVNPETGKPGICKAKKQCRFGGSAAHYGSAEEAREAYEVTQEALAAMEAESSEGTQASTEAGALANPTDRAARYSFTKDNVPEGYKFYENGSRGVGSVPDYFGFSKGMSTVSPHNGGLWYAQRNVMGQAGYSSYFKSFEDADKWVSEKDAKKAEEWGASAGISRESALPRLRESGSSGAATPVPAATKKVTAHQHRWSTLESRYNFEVLQCDGCGATRKVYDE